MKAWQLPLLVAEGILALVVTYCTGETRTQCGSVVGATRATLIVRDDDQTTRAHMVRADVQITLNGKPALLDDLRIGDKVAVSLAEEDGTSVVRSIVAQSVRSRLGALPSANTSAPATGPLANVATFE